MGGGLGTKRNRDRTENGTESRATSRVFLFFSFLYLGQKKNKKTVELFVVKEGVRKIE